MMINKIHTKVRIKGGLRYFSLRYLRNIIKCGKCRVSVSPAFLNYIYHYFCEDMIDKGWKKEDIII